MSQQGILFDGRRGTTAYSHKMHINIPVTSYATLFESRLETSNFIGAGNSWS
jgi:hypothetical protein